MFKYSLSQFRVMFYLTILNNRKALAYDAANADVPDQPPAPTSGNSRASKNSEKAVKVATPPSPPPKAAEPEGKKTSAPMSPLLKSLLQVRNTPSKADMTLRVGDYISYSSRVSLQCYLWCLRIFLENLNILPNIIFRREAG